MSPALDVSAKPDTPDLPTGWVLARLRDILPLAYGKSLVKKSRVNSGSVPVYGSSGILGYHNESLVQGQSLIIGEKELWEPYILVIVFRGQLILPILQLGRRVLTYVFFLSSRFHEFGYIG